MKTIKNTIVILVIISILSLNISVSGITMAEIAEDVAELTKPVISKALKEKLATAKVTDLIPVTIQLKDDIDMGDVEAQAFKNAKVSMEEIELLNVDTTAFSEEKDERHQNETIKIIDRIKRERTEILKEYYSKKNNLFLKENDIVVDQFAYICKTIPYITGVLLGPLDIMELSENKNVATLGYMAVGDESLLCGTFTEAPVIIGGDVAISQGYSGDGICVGVLEMANPYLDQLGNDGSVILDNVTDSLNLIEDKEHATMVCSIIKQMVPDCTIYVETVRYIRDTISRLENLIEYGVHVINISLASYFNGEYDDIAQMMDELVRNNKVSIAVAAGNGNPYYDYVNNLAMGYNVIAVGAVRFNGTDPAVENSYTLWEESLYKESAGMVNKPEVCAPGVFMINNDEWRGTSFAAPYVAGTIAQMMSRNAGLIDKPETIKAAVIASAYHNAGTDMTYVQGTRASNEEGAGVVDAEFCYWVARNGRRTHFDTVAGQYVYTYNVYCDTTTLPFRVACTWQVTDSSIINPEDYDFDLIIYKNDVRVAGSGTYSSSDIYPVANYEIIELSPEVLQTYGNGYYQVIVRLLNYTEAIPGFRIGLAWEQPYIAPD